MKRKLSIMMFIEWFVWGAWFVPLWPYLNEQGFSATQIAWSYSTTSIAAIISPVFVGVIADRYFSAEKVLSFLHILGAIILLFVSQQTQFNSFLPVLLAYTLIYMPTIALSNSIAFRNLENTERDFPRIRVLGTIGWIFSGVVVGFLPSMFGFDDISSSNVPFFVASIASLALGLYALTLPKTAPSKNDKRQGVGQLLGIDALLLFKDRAFSVFAFCSFLFCIPLAFYYQFANGYLTQVGLSNATGWMTLGQFSEIFFMLSLPFFLARFGIKKVLMLGFATAALRYGFFMFGGTESVFLYSLLFGGILLHGASYDLYFVTAYIYTDKKAPIHMRTSAQGLLTLICMGLGALIGNVIGGQVLEHFELSEAVGTQNYDWFAVWAVGLGIIVGVGLLFWFSFNDADRPYEDVGAPLK
jgi:nucleoside transporter